MSLRWAKQQQVAETKDWSQDVAVAVRKSPAKDIRLRNQPRPRRGDGRTEPRFMIQRCEWFLACKAAATWSHGHMISFVQDSHQLDSKRYNIIKQHQWPSTITISHPCPQTHSHDQVVLDLCRQHNNTVSVRSSCHRYNYSRSFKIERVDKKNI